MDKAHRSVAQTAGDRSARNFLKSHLPTILLASSMFFTGASGYISEIILSTVSTYILGNSIEQFTVIIGLMLLMMGIGTYAQRFIGDTRLIEKFIGIEITLALLVGFAPIAIFAAFGLAPSNFKIAQYFFVTSIGFLVGFEIPLVLRINQAYAKSLGANIANTYAFDYIGACVAAFAFVYWLLRIIPLTEISFIVAGMNLAVALATFVYFWTQKQVAYPRSTLIAIGVVALILSYGYVENRQWSLDLEQKLYRDRIVFSETTRYQRLILTYGEALNEYRFYINGNLQFSSLDESIYHEQLVHPVMALVPDHRRVLILGGGDGLALREVLKYRDVEDVSLVDIDPEVIRMFSTEPRLTNLNRNAFADARVAASATDAVEPQDEKMALRQTTEGIKRSSLTDIEEVAQVTVYTIDAERFVSKTSEQWDVVIIDLPDPNSIELAKLYSREFYSRLHDVLAPNGMVALQATSPYYAKEAFLVIARSLEASGFEVLPYHDNVPSFGEWGWMLARSNAGSRAGGWKVEGLSTFEVETRYLTPEVFRRSLVFGKGWLDTVRTDVSTLMRPVVLDYYIYEGWKID